MRVRRKTPWTKQPDGTPTERSGARDWFGDQIFADARPHHAPAGYGTSFVAHTGGTVALLVLVWMQPPRPPITHPHQPLMMPVILSVAPITYTPSRDASPAAPTPVPNPPPAPMRDAPAPPPIPADGDAAVAPIDAPASVTPEPDIVVGRAGVAGGVPDAAPTDAAGGVVDGSSADARGGTGSAAGPVRAGGGISPPRKIKDAKAAYPMAALSMRARGTVILDITIDVAGKVADARILQSIPVFDQAALDAVRQWEYEPSILNGVPVAVLVTVVLDFHIQ